MGPTLPRLIALSLVAACADSGRTGVADATVHDATAQDALADSTAIAPTVLANESLPILDLAVWRDQPVWLAGDDERLVARTIGSTLFERVLPAPPAANTGLLTANETGIYWSTSGTGMWRAPPQGEPVPLLAYASPIALQAGVDHVYYTEGFGGLWRVPAAGGDAERILELETASGLAVTADAVYVIDRLAARLVRANLDGSDPQTVTTWVGDNTMRLGVGPTHAVWSNNSTGSLQSVPLSGGDPNVLSESGASPGGDILVTGDTVLVAYGQWDAGGPGIASYPLFGLGGLRVSAGEGCDPQLATAGGLIYQTSCQGDVLSLTP